MMLFILAILLGTLAATDYMLNDADYMERAWRSVAH